MDEQKPALEDHLLIEAARSGDELAFGHLVERYQKVVFGTVVAIICDFDEAHDIAQEVFLRAWFGLNGLKDASSWAGWLRTIARNRARTWLRRQQRQPLQERLNMDIADSADSPEHHAEKAERRRLVLSALDRIPEDRRQALVLHYMEGLSASEVAAQLGITPAAVRQRLHRARQQMQEEMENIMADVIRDEAPGVEFSAEVAALINRSKALFQQVQYRAAAPILESARERAPTHTLVSLLLADAYTFARTREDLEADRGAYERALALLDEVVEREPGNTLALLRRAAVRAILAPAEEVISEQKKIIEGPHSGPFEAVAELELARRHLALGQGQEALALYRELGKNYAWLACVLHSEMGVVHVVMQNAPKAIEHFEYAVELTTPAAMETLRQTSERLLGQTYWAFWSTVDNLPTRQCQNHSWLAGLCSTSGDMRNARLHLQQALHYLRSDELGPAAPILKNQFVQQMERMFPLLAAEPEMQALRLEIGASQGS